MRFPYGRTTYEAAVRNTLTMIRAAEAAGVRRMVHVSITNPSEDSPFRCFSGKAEIERAIRESSLSHAIIRPAVLFGSEDVLINNIAWLVRRFPVFVVPGSGKYRLQPIFVEDLADPMVSAAGRETDETFDACGADVFTFNELVHLIGSAVGRRPRLLHLPPAVALAASRIIGLGLRDVVLTRDEIDGLMADLLVSAAPPTGKTRLGGWLRAHADTAGKAYARELQRHFR